jgi:hypothetical protein
MTPTRVIKSPALPGGNRNVELWDSGGGRGGGRVGYRGGGGGELG